MPRVTIEITGAQELANQLVLLDAGLKARPEPLFAAVEELWTNEFRRIIREQDPPTGPWPELSLLTQSYRKREGYGPDGPMLQRHGDLINSIQRMPGSTDEVVVGAGANLEYAAILHFGGTTSSESRHPNRPIPARPFVSLSEVLIDDTMALVAAHYFPEASAAEASGA